MTSQQLAQLLIDLETKLGSADQAVDVFWQFLTERNLTGYAQQIQRHLRHIRAQKRSETMLKVTARHTLSADTMTAIRQALHVPADAEEEVNLDENVIGGFVAEYRGLQYDGSLAQSTHQLANQLIHS